MKKVVFGSILFLSGMISSALMLASAMLHDWCGSCNLGNVR